MLKQFIKPREEVVEVTPLDMVHSLLLGQIPHNRVPTRRCHLTEDGSQIQFSFYDINGVRKDFAIELYKR